MHVRENTRRTLAAVRCRGAPAEAPRGGDPSAASPEPSVVRELRALDRCKLTKGISLVVPHPALRVKREVLGK